MSHRVPRRGLRAQGALRADVHDPMYLGDCRCPWRGVLSAPASLPLRRFLAPLLGAAHRRRRLVPAEPVQVGVERAGDAERPRRRCRTRSGTRRRDRPLPPSPTSAGVGDPASGLTARPSCARPESGWHSSAAANREMRLVDGGHRPRGHRRIVTRQWPRGSPTGVASLRRVARRAACSVSAAVDDARVRALQRLRRLRPRAETAYTKGPGVSQARARSLITARNCSAMTAARRLPPVKQNACTWCATRASRSAGR